MRSGRRLVAILLFGVLGLSAAALFARERIVGFLRQAGLKEGRTVSEVESAYGDASRQSFEDRCRAASTAWPPERLTLLAFKEERVGYPNEDDVRNSHVSRNRMGGDIFIHGGSASIGCIAIGDPAIEEVFCLAAKVPASRRRALIAPCDLRTHPDFRLPGEEPWVDELYTRLATELASFRR